MSTTQAFRSGIHVLAYSLTIITSLLLLLMLLWHISTAHLIDDYAMPEDWEDEFLREQFAGGKGALWGILFLLVGPQYRSSDGSLAHKGYAGFCRLSVRAARVGLSPRLPVWQRRR